MSHDYLAAQMCTLRARLREQFIQAYRWKPWLNLRPAIAVTMWCLSVFRIFERRIQQHAIFARFRAVRKSETNYTATSPPLSPTYLKHPYLGHIKWNPRERRRSFAEDIDNINMCAKAFLLLLPNESVYFSTVRTSYCPVFAA